MVLAAARRPVVPDGALRSSISYEHLIPIAASGLLRVGLTDPGSLNLATVDDQGVPVGGWCMPTPSTPSPERSTLPRTASRPESGDLRTGLSPRHPGLLAGRPPAGGRHGEALLLHRARPARRPLWAPSDGNGPRRYLEILGDCDLSWAVRPSAVTSSKPKSLGSA